METTKEQNKKLIERYPFLMPRNRWTGKVPEDYDYSYTELDAIFSIVCLLQPSLYQAI